MYLPSLGFFAFVAAAFRGHRALVIPAAVFIGLSTTHMARFTDPLELWAHAARQAPDNPRALGAWGAALREAGRLEEAEGALRRAVELAPDYPEPALDLAMVLAAAGKLKEAAAAAEGQVRRHPSPRAFNNLGVIMMRDGQWRRARAALESAQASAPGDPEISLNLAWCLLQAGESARALELFEVALAADPRRWEAVKAAARLEGKAGKRERARERLERFRSLLEADPPPKGTPEEAAAAWRNLLEEARAEAARY